MKLQTTTILLLMSLVTLAQCQGTLLEMSQELWSKLLAGGLTKVGKLDPLRVPVVKVDQSEGDTSYRMILKNVEIRGLNESTLESIHIARGRLKSNLSELEAGYVSYSDLRDLDTIRYRFHTLIKEPKTQNESFEAIVSATNQENKFKAESASRNQDSRLERLKQYDPFLLKLQQEEMKEELPDTSKDDQKGRSHEAMYGALNMGTARVQSKMANSQVLGPIRQPYDAQMVYAQRAMNSRANSRNSEETEDTVDCRGDCQLKSPSYERNRGRSGEQFEDVEVSASENFETRLRSQDQRTQFRYSALDRLRQDSPENTRKGHFEDQPGYMDIVYAGEKDNGSLKRFGNSKIDPRQEARVYGLEDVMKDIRENRRFIIHNFTEGESLTKRNDAIKAAMDARRLKDMIRYAKNFQEKEGYFEEGMQLVYHYGGMGSNNSKSFETSKRHKRAHNERHTEEDVMHVILKIRVPLLRVKSEYQLMGKVGKEILRGNGQLIGNFTEVIGDFTLELKKVNDDMMIVRAARSKLVAKDHTIDLQGMDEEGPVSSILNHGLMAAEAVAAMLADDLATKALNEKTADAMIYRMYKNLPSN